MEFPEYWKVIIRDALAEGIDKTGAPVPGAKLKPLIAEKASARGHEIPASSIVSFKNFLASFPDVVKIFPRPGQDFLVVPPGREDLLRAGATLPVIKRDLFQAFTYFDAINRPWYAVETDQVTWFPPSEDAPSGLLAIPPATEEREVGLRRAFAENIEDPRQRETLLVSLTHARPLSEFTKVIEGLGLQLSWHQYRYRNVWERINRWAADNSISVKDSWLSFVPRVSRAYPPDATRPGFESIFFAALGKMSDEDLSKVLVPLDLVLKTLRNM